MLGVYVSNWFWRIHFDEKPLQLVLISGRFRIHFSHSLSLYFVLCCISILGLPPNCNNCNSGGFSYYEKFCIPDVQLPVACEFWQAHNMGCYPPFFFLEPQMFLCQWFHILFFDYLLVVWTPLLMGRQSITIVKFRNAPCIWLYIMLPSSDFPGLKLCAHLH